MALNDLIVKQNICASILSKTISNYKKTSLVRRTRGLITARLNDAEKVWKDFVATHYEIERAAQKLSSEERESMEYFTKDLYSETEEKYFDFVGLLSDTIDTFNPSNNSTTIQSSNGAQSTQSGLKLPPITLPTFSGSYETWRSFYDLFLSLVHTNSALSPVQKLHYLKSSVTGEAEQLLRQFQVTGANYENAWKVLLERYDNKRVLINAQHKRLFEQSVVSSESAKSIKNLLDRSSECIFELEALGVSTKEWDTMLIYVLVQKLPSETHRMWEQEINTSPDLPTFAQLKKFLESRFRTLEAISDTKPSKTDKVHLKGRALTHFTSSGTKCNACNEIHPLYKCSKFLALDIDKRHKFVNSNRLCSNCLSSKHLVNHCPSKFLCHRCGRKHHTILHRNNVSQYVPEGSNKTSSPTNLKGKNTEPTKGISPQVAEIKNQPIQTFYTNRNTRTSHALLSTALVRIASKAGSTYIFRALIDSGSQVSFITEAAARKLQLKSIKTSVQITGLGKTEALKVYSRTTVKIESLQTNQKATYVTALIVPTITEILPYETIPIDSWHHIKDLNLADPSFHQPGQIDVLLGADIYSEILLDGLRRGSLGMPIAQNSTLGWIIFGNICKPNTSSFSMASSFTINAQFYEDNSLDKLLLQFWENEEVFVERKHSKRESDCEAFYKSTYSRDTSGRYEVRLPFLNNQPPCLGNSRNMALNRFYHLEKKFSQNPELAAEYRKCITEYASMGHMTPVTVEKDHTNSYCLPHHAVLTDSSTTKVRVVFDASAKSSNGRSLNEQLHTGPVLQAELFSILLRWRKYKYEMSADIEKMYRMVNVHFQDRKYQRILWRNNPNEVVKDYALTTVIFGTTPAPYLAIRTLHQLAKDEAINYPSAAKLLVKDFYVDDLITGADSLNEALENQTQLISLLRSGGFNLRKLASNSSELLINIPEEHREVHLPLRFTNDESVKALGIHWYPESDHFSLQYRQVEDRPTSKRSVLSEIATLFDPLGWISPIVVTGKILMQKLWLSGVLWDDPLPPALNAEWQHFKSELHHISEISIPRWLHMSDDAQNVQIHGFSDASQYAYSAAVYIRTVDREGNIHINLLTAKSKVAPTKPFSLPRLELCGALLLARLIQRTKGDLNISDVQIFAWIDSTIALAWIRSHPNKFKTFVANRVSEIQDLLRIGSWRHVKSQDNPADCNSRGLKPSCLINHDLWWHGPSWLREPQHNWPVSKVSVNLDNDLEQKKITHISHVTSITEDIILKFSSFTRLVRTVAYCLRFAFNCRVPKNEQRSGFLSTHELQESELALIKMSQEVAFNSEMKTLKEKLPISVKSNLLSLNPFLDESRVIRVGGRLKHSYIPYSQRHPIILPRNSHLTTLIIKYYHLKTLHGGTQLVLTTIRNKYWIPSGRKTVRNIIHRCINCHKHSVKLQNQIMGNLPSSRVNISRPFQHTGIDYAGPINLRMSKYRGVRSYKGNICIFVCMATKAIHIEPVSDLSTAAFIGAFRRFISRRGLCTDIYSDCGSNFIGANNIINKDLNQAIKCANKSIAEQVAHEGIKWHFNPPAAPHFGELWEAGVKSIKYHLKRTLGNSILTFEEFATILSQIEACLNSRPLCPISDDPDDSNALTPAHFLIGSSMTALPEAATIDKVSSLARWNHLQTLKEHFWKRWSKDYLNSLQNRPKWQKASPNPHVGDLVILKEENTPPCRWPLGRITHIHPGEDNMVRVVTVKTTKGVFKRPITKCSIVPISNKLESNLIPQHKDSNPQNKESQT